MAKKNDAANSTNGEAQVLEFANSNLSLEMLTRRATVLLTTKNLVRIARELTPGDQAKFLDKLDQVCQVVLIEILRPCICEGIPPSGLAKCETCNRPGKLVQ